MKNFFRDYMNLAKQGREFTRKYWIFYVIYLIICFALMFTPGIVKVIQEHREEKKLIVKQLKEQEQN